MAATISAITGGTGFVGEAVVRRLLDEGDTVRVLVQPGREGGLAPDLRGKVELVRGDVTDFASLVAAFDGASRVVHSAALVGAFAPYREFERINVLGTENVCRACVAANVARTVVVSTSDVFGLPSGDRVITEQTEYRAWGEAYPDTKIKAAEVVRRYQREGLPVTLVYPGWVYGHGDRAFLPSIAEILRDGMAVVWGEGERFELSLVDVEDLAQGILLAIEHPDAVGEDFLLLDDASGVSVEDFYQRVGEELGYDVNVRKVPYWLVLLVAKVTQWATRLRLMKEPVLRTNDVKSFGYAFRFSTEKARRVLGWAPQVSSDQGIARAIAWYRDNLDPGA
jgi:nucleoside-diphosphate-sugar epimerase